jgi:hypothetical protein
MPRWTVTPTLTSTTAGFLFTLYSQYKDEYSALFDPKLPKVDPRNQLGVLRKAMLRATAIDGRRTYKQVLCVLLQAPKLNHMGYAVLVALYINHKEDIKDVLVEMGYTEREISNFLDPRFYALTIEGQVGLLRGG